MTNSPKANKHTEVGKVSPEWVKKNLGDEAYEKVMEYLEDDAINVIFTNNKGSQRVAMTSWIIAHRIGHALSRNDVDFVTRRQIQSYEESEKIIIEYFTEILKDGYGFPRKHNNSDSLRNDRLTQLGITKLGQAVCTFRSAREKNLRDWFEITNELFAQFLTTSNGIQFNSLPEFIQVGKSAYRLTTDKIMADELAYRLQNQISTLEIYFDSIMTESHNAIFVM